MADAPSEDEPAGQTRRESGALAKKLDPFGIVVLTRERVQEIFDEAVSRGRMTTSDAQQLVAEIVKRSIRQTDDVLSDLEQLLTGPRPGAGGEPLEGYDELTASEVVGRLGALDREQLRAVRDHERRNANRKTVLEAVERALAE